ncbi:hypothetical protein AX16_008982 [Volvariella volvacea WC 439]|nr:hypothetical protein AX16_008982 [Volvariella volvacea WC 439]
MVDLYTTIEQCGDIRSLSMAWESTNDNEVEDSFVMEIQEGVMRAVLRGTKGQLERLDIKPLMIPQCPLPKALLQFKHLLSFKFIRDDRAWGCEGEVDNSDTNLGEHDCIRDPHMQALQAVVHNNRQLKELRIDHDCDIHFHDACALFSDASDTKRIQPLALRILTISGIQFSSALGPHRSPFSKLQHLRVDSIYSHIPLDNLWISLQASETTLKTLITFQASDRLVYYLASYSGLQELVIEDIETPLGCTTLFFDTALPKHASSLTKLSISLGFGIEYLHGWSFAPSLWMPALNSLRILKYLQLSPGTGGGISLDSTPEIHDFDERTLQIFLSYQEMLDGICQLEGLETLEIFKPFGVRGSGTQYADWTDNVVETLERVVEQLRSKTKFPSALVLFSGRYCSTRAKGGGSGALWHYIRISDEFDDS